MISLGPWWLWIDWLHGKKCGLIFCCSCNCFPKFLKFWTLLFILSFLRVRGFMNSILFFPLLQFRLSWGQLFSCFSKNCCVCKCFGSWSLKFDLKVLSFDLNDFFQCYQKSISVRIKFLVLFVAMVSEKKQTTSIVAPPKSFEN